MEVKVKKAIFKDYGGQNTLQLSTILKVTVQMVAYNIHIWEQKTYKKNYIKKLNQY